MSKLMSCVHLMFVLICGVTIIWLQSIGGIIWLMLIPIIISIANLCCFNFLNT